MLNKDCDASLKLALQRVFSVVAKRANTTELELNTAKVSTYRLTNHYVVFDRLITDFAAEIAQFINKNGRGMKLYMIVGFKTIVDQHIRLYHKSLAEKRGKATVPVGEGIQAGSGAPPVIHADDGATPGVFGRFEDIECELSDSEQGSDDDVDKLRIGGLPATEQDKYLLKKDGAGNEFYLRTL
ncbi:hypothetical protein N7522_006249 [Penicillium canescens]|nr:hypothetical protein N7522_006249 [Penicillium canescens]